MTRKFALILLSAAALGVAPAQVSMDIATSATHAEVSFGTSVVTGSVGALSDLDD